MKPGPLLLAAILLGGCAGVVRNESPSVVYDFGPPPAASASSAAWPGLALAVKSPPWFESLNLDYRLAYDDAQILREYAGSRWAGAPGVLLAQRLTLKLGAASEGAANVACLLRVDLHEFAQRFDTPQRSVGVLQATASVFDAKRRLIDRRRFTVEQVATRADAQGGANALAAAGGEFGQRLGDWLVTLEHDARHAAALRACRQ